MTSSPHPPPRPRPSPGPPAAGRPLPIDTSTREASEPTPSEPTPSEPTPRAAGGRAERRRAERAAQQRTKYRWLTSRTVPALVVLVGLLLAGTIALIAWPSGNSTKVRSSASSTAADPADAALRQPEVATAFVAAAATSIQVVTTFDYRRLDDALNAGSSITTGAYQKALRAALTGPTGAAAKRNHVVQTFDLVKIGIGTIDSGGTRAKVLAFGIERATSLAGSAANPITLTATMQRTGNRYLISQLAAGTNAGLPDGSDGLRAAAEAARREVINTLSFRRSSFAADEQRAESGATGALLAKLQRKSASTKSALEKGGYDLTGAVTAIAVGSAQRTSVVMLVAATGVRVTSGGTQTQTTDGRFVVTVVRTTGGWLVADIANASGA